MTCSCSGVDFNKCKCRELRKISLKNVIDRKNPLNSTTDTCIGRKTLTGCLEKAYEKCAAYNLRYCPMRGYVEHTNNFKKTISDIIILVCFLIANFVVFMAIITRITFHICFVILEMMAGIRRYLNGNKKSNEGLQGSLAVQQSDLNPKNVVETKEEGDQNINFIRKFNIPAQALIHRMEIDAIAQTCFLKQRGF